MKLRTNLAATLPAILAVGIWGASAMPGSAYECLEGLATTPFDTSNNCLAQPNIDRVFGSQVVRWKNHDYLFVNTGNDIKIWNIDTPQNPTTRTTSHFGVQNVGDSDYDMLNFSVCDDCRYGLAYFISGTILFDLGTDTAPSFRGQEFYHSALNVKGGFTFSHGGQQYLIAADVGDACTSGKSGLYEFNGVAENNLQSLGCVLTSSGGNTTIVNGLRIDDYIYAGNSSQHVMVFRIDDSATPLELDYVTNPFLSYMILDKALAIDTAQKIAVQTDTSGMTIWDLANPGAPQEMASVSGSWNRAAVFYPFAWVGKKGSLESERSFDITDPGSPVEVDHDFWTRDNPFTFYDHGCVDPQAGAFAPDGSVLYLMRYSKLQLVNTANCLGPVPPTAVVEVTPTPVFPGSSVLVKNLSTGAFDRSAIWITASADPGGTLVAGSRELAASTPSQRSFAIAQDIWADVDYWAHVAVESDEFEYDPLGSTPRQIDTRAVFIDRTPQVVALQLDPPAPITGDPQLSDPVLFTPVAQGAPAGAPAYEWLVQGPNGGPQSYQGAPLSLELDESGHWSVTATVHYLHEVENGSSQPGSIVTYETSLTRELDISSVYADFSYSPENPVNTEPLILTSRSTLGAGATPSYQWSIGGATTYTGCPDTAVCTVPAETLNDGLHSITLRVTNTANGDWSEATITDVEVTEGHIDLDFYFSPSDPDIGDTITFNISGVSVDIEGAEWDFGGTTCSDSGLITPYFCDPSEPYTFGCRLAGFQYATGGDKTVSLSVVVGGQSYGPVSRVVPVSDVGSCSSSSCTYSLSSSTADFSAGGGSGQFTVNADAGCLWSAASDAGWLQITAGSSGDGSGTVQYSVASNDGAERSASIVAGSRTHSVTQSGVDVDFGWAPTGPDIGETVLFSISGVDEVASVVWDFGEVGCSSLPQITSCYPGSGDCLEQTHVYPSSGSKSVSLTVTLPAAGGTIGPITHSVGVTNEGSCAASPPAADTWVLLAVDGLGARAHTAASSLAVHNGYLYAGSTNMLDGCAVWRSADGTSWQQVANGGFGDADNTAVSAMVSFGNQLVAATRNESTGAEVWRSSDGLSWSQVGGDGLGDADNEDAPAFAVHTGDLYLGTRNATSGAQVWRTASGSLWEQVNQDGFGSSSNEAATTLASFDFRLFATSTTYWELALWERELGTSWVQRGTSGFGNSSNLQAGAARVFAGQLYLGVDNASDGAQVWRSSDGLSWSQSNSDGFDSGADNPALRCFTEHAGQLFAGVRNQITGAEIWRSADGTSWVRSGAGGFGDPRNLAVTSAADFNGMLIVGTENASGFQLWKLDPEGTLFRDDFESGNASRWSNAVGSVP